MVKQTKATDHTPGPWEVGDGGQHVFFWPQDGPLADDPRADSVIARCCGMGPMSGIPDDEREANARLIAAAPSLLEACRDAYEHALADTLSRLDQPQLTKLGKAIAKAEGVAS